MKDKIIEDLKCRNLNVISFICETEDGKIQLISYDDNGLVSHVSEKVETLSISQRLDGGMVQPMFDIVRKEGK